MLVLKASFFGHAHCFHGQRSERTRNYKKKVETMKNTKSLNIRNYWVILVAGLLLNCGPLEEGYEKSSFEDSLLIEGDEVKFSLESIEVKRESLSEFGLQLKLLQGVSANDYRVFLTWNGIENFDGFYEVSRQRANGTSEKIARLEPQESAYLDSTLHLGEEVHYQLEAILNDEIVQKTALISVWIPQDVVIRERNSIHDVAEINPITGEYHLEAERVFFERNAVIEIGESSLRIRAKEVHSKGGVIRAYGPNARAGRDSDNHGLNGRSSGDVSITAEKGIGRLAIHTNGEHGGHGVKGRDGRNGENGAAGRSGRMFERTGERISYTSCTRQPRDGSPGTDGTSGTDGTRGGHGGNAGDILVKIVDFSSSLEVQARAEAGLKGSGGSGGKAGEGGRGGKGGHSPAPCRATSRGSNGKNGDAGKDARGGSGGRPGMISILQSER
jgi:hypothetical protein